MFGKMVLPWLGGSPSVWTTCMLFFQAALLLGYLYAHLGPRWLGVRRHALLHLSLLVLWLLALPVRMIVIPGTLRVEHPTAWLITVLGWSIAAPFILLSSTGPLLQVWFSRTSHPGAQNPYFLYAASNSGSLLALLSYPFIMERMLPLAGQAQLWSIGYVIVVVLVGLAVAAMVAPEIAGPAEPETLDPPISLTKRARWIALAFVPSSLFLALTTYVTTDVAAVPLLWVVPLVLYLLSFTLVFSRRAYISHSLLVRWQPVGLIALVILNFWGPSGSSPWLVPLHLIVLFATALVCHGELAASKPPSTRLTDFYLCIAVGGLLGGIFNALIAPSLFASVQEYSLTLLAACALRPSSQAPPLPHRARQIGLVVAAGAILVLTRLAIDDRKALAPAIIASVLAAVICLRFSRDPVRFTLAIAGVVLGGGVIDAGRSGVLLRERNFFGVREVRDDTRNHRHVLLHGTTEHGAQSTDPEKRRQPLSYYSMQGPAGDVFRALPAKLGRRVAVIGLGTGALAAYGGTGDQWVFYEIDPDIARVARDTNYFTYLRDTPASVELVFGDGRLSLAEAPPHRYDLLVIDAFNSDAIPIHLLTLEALSMYWSKLSESGVVLFHLSNRYLDLEPVLGQLARAANLSGLIREDTRPRPDLVRSGAEPSIWAVLSAGRASLQQLQQTPGWRQLRVRKAVRLWTDDFSNIFSVYRWP